jgi:hypothetical protein
MNRENRYSESNTEFKNAVSSLGFLAKIDPGRHKSLVISQCMNILTNLNTEELTQMMVDELDVIKDCINTLLKVEGESKEQTVFDSNRPKAKKSSDVNSLTNGDHKLSGSLPSGTVSSKFFEGSKLNDNKVPPKKDRKSEVNDDEAARLIAQHSQSSDRDNQSLAAKNSWLDTNRKKYYSDIDEMFQSGHEQVVITVELKDFKNLDFGDYHGSVKTTSNNFTAYRWDKDPYQSIIYFFNMITKGSKKKDKEIPKLFFDVKRIRDPKALVHDVFVSVSPLDRNKDRQKTDSPIVKEVGGIQEDDSEDESVVESVSTNKSKESGSSPSALETLLNQTGS